MQVLCLLRRSLNEFSSERKGAVAIIFGVALLPAMMFTGVAVDYVRAQSAQQALQNAVDSAALGGSATPGAADGQRIAMANTMFDANFPVRHYGTPARNALVVDGNIVVAASMTLPTIFTKLMHIDSFPLSASAVAMMPSGGGTAAACLLALSPNQSDGIHVQGSNNLAVNGCWAWANSTSTLAITGTGGAAAAAQGFCTPGNVSDNGNYTPRPQTGCFTIADPYAGKLPAPASSNCAANAAGVKYSNGTATINPGTFCGGLELKPQAKVTFNPGVYVIKNGPLTLQAGSTGTGTGVVFVLEGDAAYVNIRGGATASFKAPSGKTLASGAYDGFVVIKNATAGAECNDSVIQGGGTVALDGVIYLPKQDLYVGGNGDLNVNSKLFAMIANRFYLQGNGTLHMTGDAVASGYDKDLLPKTPGAGRLIN